MPHRLNDDSAMSCSDERRRELATELARRAIVANEEQREADALIFTDIELYFSVGGRTGFIDWSLLKPLERRHLASLLNKAAPPP